MTLGGKWALTGVCTVLAAMVMAQTAREERSAPPREVVVAGRVVDFHTLMTGKARTDDEEKSVREAIQAGVPAALETKDGILVLGQGWKGPRLSLVRFAFQEVQIKGHLYEKGNLHYLDIEEIKPVESQRSEHEEQAEPGEDPAPEPRPDHGACCLPDGGCSYTTFESCSESNGNFYIGVTCEEVDCRHHGSDGR